MDSQTLRFFKNHQLVKLENIPPDRTLLELIREDLDLKGTKEGCAEGDCGACTVVVGRLENGRPSLHAINSCILRDPCYETRNKDRHRPSTS